MANEEKPEKFSGENSELKSKYFNFGFSNGLGEALIVVGKILEETGLE